MSLPGLSLSAAPAPSFSPLPIQPGPGGVASPSALGLAPATLPSRIQPLAPRTELRFEVGHGREYSIRVVAGSAELFGTELAPAVTHRFTGTQAAIFSWHGAELELSGHADSEYVAQETDATLEWMNLHGMLESARDDAAAMPAAGVVGPRVLVVGPDHVGKSSLVRTLAAWAVRLGRCPTVVNLDARDGLLAPPGTFSAVTLRSPPDVDAPGGAWGYSPISGPTPSPVKTPLVYHFPFCDDYKESSSGGGSSGQADDGAAEEVTSAVFKPLTTRMALAVTSKLESDPAARAAGLLIDSSSALNRPRTGYDALLHIVGEFSVNVVVVLGSERLYSDLTRRLSPSHSSTSTDEHVIVLRVAASGGAVSRDQGAMRAVRQTQLRTYFFGDGPRAPLHPHGQWWDYADLSVWRAGDAAAARVARSFMPGADDDDDGGDEGQDGKDGADARRAQRAKKDTAAAAGSIYTRTTPSRDMLHAVLAVKLCAASRATAESVRDSCVMGLVYVAEVDEARKKVRFLAPHPSRWGECVLVWGSWPEPVADLIS